MKSIEWKRWLGVSLLLVGAALILIWRRPDQFLHPYVWVEEGTVTLPAYIAHGWASIFSPVAGYLVVPAKLVFLLAASISFIHLPAITYWLTIALTVAVVATVAYSPTVLPWPKLCAIAMLLVPSDSEVFGVSEYVFWWATLLAVVPLLWNPEAKSRTLWRCFLVTVGGLSSPMILPVTALLAFRAAWLRRKAEAWVLATGVAVSAVQLAVMHANHTVKPGNLTDLGLEPVVIKFFGYFAWWHAGGTDLKPFALGCAVVALLGAFAWRHKQWTSLGFMLLAGCLAASIAISVTRMPVTVIHPVLAGPRYFFYPYIFLAWLLIYAAAHSERGYRHASVFVLLLAGAQFLMVGQRRDGPMKPWSDQVAACGQVESFTMPIQFDGEPSRAWHVELTGSQCRALTERGLFRYEE